MGVVKGGNLRALHTGYLDAEKHWILLVGGLAWAGLNYEVCLN